MAESPGRTIWVHLGKVPLHAEFPGAFRAELARRMGRSSSPQPEHRALTQGRAHTSVQTQHRSPGQGMAPSCIISLPLCPGVREEV